MPDEHLNFLNKFTTCKQKMAAINVCDKTKLGKTTSLKLNSINLSDKVYSLKQNICKETENSLENIGKYVETMLLPNRVLRDIYSPKSTGNTQE